MAVVKIAGKIPKCKSKDPVAGNQLPDSRRLDQPTKKKNPQRQTDNQLPNPKRIISMNIINKTLLTQKHPPTITGDWITIGGISGKIIEGAV